MMSRGSSVVSETREPYSQYGDSSDVPDIPDILDTPTVHPRRIWTQTLRRAFAEARAARDVLACHWFCLGSTALVEIALQAAPDLVVIDRQHGLWERHSLEAALGVARGRAPVIVRCADHSAVAISEALDAGAASVLVPLVESAAQARAAVAHGRYPPEGVRSAGGVRPLLAGVETMPGMNRHIAVGVMIETLEGVEQVEAIAAVPGLDYIFIGTGDLGLCRANDPKRAQAIERDCARVLAAARVNGLSCGIFSRGIDAALKRRTEGYDIVVAVNDVDLAQRGFIDAEARWREAANA